MTYFKLHLKRIVALLIVVVFMLITYGILGYFYHELTIVFPLFFLSAILLMDGFVIYRFKGDLFDEKYKGGVSYYAFKFFIYAFYHWSSIVDCFIYFMYNTWYWHKIAFLIF